MNTKNIIDEIQSEISKSLVVVGKEGFEFGLTKQIADISSFTKAEIWFKDSPEITLSIYKTLCKRFELKFNEDSEGEYLYILIK